MRIIRIAWRNLLRHKRRSLLTAMLIMIGVMLVIVFGGVGNSFKSEMIGLITNANLGDIQIHRKGYVGSIDNLPLDITIPEQGLAKIEALLKQNTNVEAYSKRIRLGVMISNFTQTTNMRFTAIYPQAESRTCSGLTKRIVTGEAGSDIFVKPGSIVIPQNIAAGMDLKVGSEVVLIATNKNGSVNGLTLTVAGISENILGPQGKDGYIHMEDAESLLQIENGEIMEIAVKLKDFNTLRTTFLQLQDGLSQIKGGKAGNSPFEIHTWEDLSPFSSIAQIVSLLIMVVRIVLFFIVLVSILNVMTMSVYERVGEIGTIASIGTQPSRILALFLTEGLSLGFISAVAGNVAGVTILALIDLAQVSFTFGRREHVLSPHIPVIEILITLAVVILVSVFASLQPARKAARMEPVDALRHV